MSFFDNFLGHEEPNSIYYFTSYYFRKTLFLAVKGMFFLWVDQK